MEAVIILIILVVYMLIQGMLMVLILVKVGERKGDDPLIEEIKRLSAEVGDLREMNRSRTPEKK